MTDFFSPDYLTARDRFRSGILASGGQLESIILDARGPGRSDKETPGGEDLTIDIGWFGSPQPRRAFVHSSGLHGVEGFAGSAVQLQWLEDGIPELGPGCAIALVHVMNPFGMAWLRRVNENNVDLNRNFLSADKEAVDQEDVDQEYAGAPELYAALNSFLNPESPPSRDLFLVRAAWNVLRYGTSAFRRAVSDGQYDFPRGLSFGGKQHEQATRRFQLYISGRLACVEHVTVIDLHTGIHTRHASFGEDSLLVDGTGDRTARAAEMQLAYGNRVQSCAAQARGTLDRLYFRMFPTARVCFAVQRFGACSPVSALAALRAENRQHHYGSAGVDHPAKARLFEVFCPPDKKWREKVLARGKAVIAQGLRLAFEGAPTSTAADRMPAD